MNAQPSRTPWHPRILMVPAATAREGAALAAAAAHARDLGFDHLLLAGFDPGHDGNDQPHHSQR